jgi:hypothetical protein
MPKGRLELLRQAKKVTEVTDANLVLFGWQETTVAGKYYQAFFDGPFTTFKNAVEAWEDPATRTPVIIEKVIEAEKVFIPAYREIYAALKANKSVLNHHLEAMTLPPRPTNEHSPAPVATNPPAFEISPLPAFRLKVDFFPYGVSEKRGKPAGQHGAEIKWGFSEVPVYDAEKLEHSSFDTASPFILTFSGDDSGRKLYVALRWENSRGLKGPWSVPVETRVPH